jgi:hypothetical protein
MICGHRLAQIMNCKEKGKSNFTLAILNTKLTSHGLNRTIEGVLITECYHVTFSQKPSASISPDLVLAACLTSFFATNGAVSATNLPMNQPRSKLSLDLSQSLSQIEAGMSECSAFWTLCCLSLLLPRFTSSDASSSINFNLHHRKRLESALNNCLKVNKNAEKNSLILLHAVCLRLHVNVDASYWSDTRAFDDLMSSPPKAKDGQNYVFLSGNDRIKSVWHASRILQLGSQLIKPSTEPFLWQESPHLCHCIYMAALIVWHAGRFSSPGRAIDDARAQNFINRSSVRMAIDLISASHVSSTKQLIRILWPLTQICM